MIVEAVRFIIGNDDRAPLSNLRVSGNRVDEAWVIASLI
jgi:hypothetical protein